MANRTKTGVAKATDVELDALLDRVDNRVATLESRLGLLADQHKGSTQKGAPAPEEGEVQKEPVMRLRGSKWVIGHYRNCTVTLTADQLDKRHTVYVYSCRRCKIVLQGKCANLSVDICADSEVEVEQLKSVCEMVNCKNMVLNVKIDSPVISFNNCDVVSVNLLSEHARASTKVVSCLSSGLSLSFPSPSGGGGELVHRYIPQQYVHTIAADLSLVSVASSPGGEESYDALGDLAYENVNDRFLTRPV